MVTYLSDFFTERGKKEKKSEVVFRSRFTLSWSHNKNSEKIVIQVCSKYIHSNLDIANKSVRPFLFTISNNSLY